MMSVRSIIVTVRLEIIKIKLKSVMRFVLGLKNNNTNKINYNEQTKCLLETLN